ncbi:fluoride efflux transporter CrcB [Paracoccus kondratievae]|uniref:Fluoride-specific ion channel FluC n=1 Tax=Paracoccus kondratievae TaxID=135740 RepID=A0AAD3P1T5_9RHOB|nr:MULTISPECIES: fluoride efflux transporter CrcB [Paracoccus]QFQ87537.1 fluoride efflux transporter CrcB [Paracoccus kondratievae]GLK66037.1 putative fluoride ion transporter CrcB [Paracoccus kondratievae]SMG40205.1 camphor resistance protein CrcB [Paracoccus sp. J56]
MTHTFLQVGLGGALGSAARYGVNILAGRMTQGFPLGTLIVNIVGCLAMGLLAALLAHRGGQHLAPFLLTGVLGGFTTFSAFALDTATLWERGAGAVALGYVLCSVILSLAAVVMGLVIGRGLFS